MDIEMAKQILGTAVKTELRDHAFGDCEVEWHDGETCVGSGYFSGSSRSVSIVLENDCGHFWDTKADELRKCFASEQVSRNDETGPDEFELRKVMPGLTLEGVHEELTQQPKEQ